MLFEIFPADNPPVPVLGIGTHGSPEVISEITFTVPVNTVRHAARNLQAFHSRQTSLCVCLVESQAQHKKGYNTAYPFHVHLILSSLITLAATMSEFSTRMVWCLPPFFSTSSITKTLSSGIVNCGTVYTVRTVLLPPITSISL